MREKEIHSHGVEQQIADALNAPVRAPRQRSADSLPRWNIKPVTYEQTQRRAEPLYYGDKGDSPDDEDP